MARILVLMFVMICVTDARKLFGGPNNPFAHTDYYSENYGGYDYGHHHHHNHDSHYPSHYPDSYGEHYNHYGSYWPDLYHGEHYGDRYPQYGHQQQSYPLYGQYGQQYYNPDNHGIGQLVAQPAAATPINKPTNPTTINPSSTAILSPGSATAGGVGQGTVQNGVATGTGTGIAQAGADGFGIGLGIGIAVATPLGNFVVGDGSSIAVGK